MRLFHQFIIRPLKSDAIRTITTIVGFYNSPVTLRGQRSDDGPWEPVRPEVYVQRRVPSMAFAPSTVVFPGGGVDPDSFTHGTSEQRARWFAAGDDSGEPGACDTFSADG